MADKENRFKSFPDEFEEIGSFGSTHGLKGEINMLLSASWQPEEGSFVFVDIDSTMIPLRIDGLRRRADQAFIVKFAGIDSEDRAKFLKGRSVFVDSGLIEAESDDDNVYLEDLEGYEVEKDGTHYGEVVATDDSTENALIIVRRSDNSEIIIPFAESYIGGIDPSRHIIEVNLPEDYEDLFTT